VLEAELARKWGKGYDMCLHDDHDVDLWDEVAAKIRKLNLAHCKATVAEDKEQIVKYAQRNVENGIQGLNQRVQQMVMQAQQRARLMAAATNGDVRALESINITELESWRSVRGRTLTHIAASQSKIAVLSTLLRRTCMSQLDLLDAEGNSPLSVASCEGALAGAQALLGYQCEVNGNVEHGLSPLHLVAAAGHASIAVLLIRSSADIEKGATYTNVKERRPVHVAAREGSTDVVSILARHRADLSATAGNGMTVLYHAVSGVHPETVSCLIRCQAAVNQANADDAKRTPLMGGISKNSPVIVASLLTAAADVSVLDGHGLSCLKYISSSQSRETPYLI